jgi:hypothetical protein
MPENSSWVVGSCPVCSLLYTCANKWQVEEQDPTTSETACCYLCL